MNPGIFYLYEYKGNQRLRNTGFLKFFLRPHACEMQLRARAIPVTRQDTLILSTLWRDDGTLFSHNLAQIPCEDHSFSVHLTFTESDLTIPGSLNQIDGFLLRLPNGNCLAATLPNMMLDMIKIQEYKEPKQPAESNSKPIVEPSTPSAAEVYKESLSPTISASKTPAVTPEDTSAVPPEDTSAEVISAEIHPFEISENSQDLTSHRSIRKIQRSDLSVLPRKCWYLSNNSFLLHGYYNYHHLLLVEENGHFWLGVPGIYDSREAHAAELFGFPQFNDSYNKQLELSEEECNSQGKFGYWFHYIY